MKRRQRPILSEAQQSLSFTRRTLFLGGAQAGIGVLLATRMGWLSIAENERYALMSESNRVNLTLVPPRRGWIVDRYGRPIAINRTDFRVDLIPDRVTDPERVVNALGNLLSIDQDQRERILEDLEKAAGFQPVQVAAGLTYDQYAAISVRLPDLPGAAPARGYSRFYPDGAAVGHLVGYVGAASAKDYEKSKDPLLITPGFKVGKDCVEKMLDERMRGQPGAKRTEVTARGKLVRELATRPDVPGHPVKLTIDAGLQAFAARRIGTQSGACVVIDCTNGDILAMASMPCYDPNSFSDGISHAEWGMLSEDERVPLMNKTMQGLYPPGSTFKPITALALQQAGIDPEEIVHCGGGYQLGNRRFACLGRHGAMNLHRAIAKSCNTYFYTMGRRAGIDGIAEAARALGLGAEYTLPMPSQKYGTVPDPAWKQRRYKQNWSVSDTLNTSIGQGYLQVSPLQLAVMASRVASGRMLVPRLMAGGSGKPAPPLPYSPEYVANIRSGMDEVVNGAGTAGRSRLPLEGIRMGGKTGTAQVRNFKGGARRGLGIPWKFRDHGLFVGFAPVDNPRYATAVVIEHGMSGSGAAAPVASDTLLYLFDPAKAMAKLEAFEKEWGGDIATRMAADATRYKAAREAAANPAIATAQAEAVVANASNASNAAASRPASTAAPAEEAE
ncbi:penicillin-binding protein 2 [Sphingomonas cavernae]|uniref:Penicillin-binding protein 2 n=1 Tax=Sphingomonas cavernae TaxID=2320861 RepID=A0A418WSA6_9SPHN|nr:penicillin-binding protein 2 [Sphingomonas cavernae]RJF94138.1 penicillin-binding protein 2 [Sphingomonas cavernae]